MARKTRQRSHGGGSLFKRNGRGPWIASWYDHSGKRRERSTRTTDKAAAERILAKRVADAALRRDGVIDARADRYADAERRPLSEHVAEWTAGLTADGVTPKQVGMIKARAELLLNAIKAERISELSASAIQNTIGELHAGGKGLQTCQHYLRAVKQFSRWLKRDGRIRDDVLAHLTGYNASTDRRHERRPLTVEELGWLIDVTSIAPMWRRMAGTDRAMLYRVATGTGFRAGELRSLTPASFHLDADPPAVTLEASQSKHRQADRQPIRRDLADLLGSWLAGKPADRPVFATMPDKTAIMLRQDLRRARARWIRAIADPRERRQRRDSDFLAITDGAGRVVDFHALRATYITMLVKGGASVKEAQALARHSDPKLTLNVYTRLGVNDLAGALDALPSSTGDAPQREPMRATGTYDSSPEAPTDPPQYPPHLPPQLGRETVRGVASPCGESAVSSPLNQRRKSLCGANISKALRFNARLCGNAPGRIRTCDLRFRKPMLYPAELRALLGVIFAGRFAAVAFTAAFIHGLPWLGNHRLKLWARMRSRHGPSGKALSLPTFLRLRSGEVGAQRHEVQLLPASPYCEPTGFTVGFACQKAAQLRHLPPEVSNTPRFRGALAIGGQDL